MWLRLLALAAVAWCVGAAPGEAASGPRLGPVTRIVDLPLGAEAHVALLEHPQTGGRLVVWTRMVAGREEELWTCTLDDRGRVSRRPRRIYAPAQEPSRVLSYLSYLRAVPASNGGYLVVWSEPRDDDTDTRVLARHLDPTGAPDAPVRTLFSGPLALNTRPGIAHDPVTGRFLATWDDPRAPRSNDVLALVLTPSGRPLTGVPVAVATTGRQGPGGPADDAFTQPGNATVAPDDDGGWWLGWTTLDGLFVRKLDAEGVSVGTARRLSSSAVSAAGPFLPHRGGGRLFVFDRYAERLFARVLGPDGTAVGARWEITQRSDEVDALGAGHDPATGRYLFAWHDGTGRRLYGQVLSGDGRREIPGPLLLSRNAVDAPAVVRSGARGGFLVVWPSRRGIVMRTVTLR